MIIKTSIKYPFSVKKIPFISRLYKLSFDNQKLSNPKLISGWRTPFRILVKFFITKIHSVGVFDYLDNTCHFDSRNTQFHSIYFNRFIENGYEPEVCFILNEIVKKQKGKDCTFYDIGANWGFFVGYFSSINNNSTIYAFEPQTLIYKNLFDFIKEAKLKYVNTFNFAVGDKKNTGTIVLPDGFHSGLGKICFTQKNDILIEKIDNLQILPPTIIKIDAESFCAKILYGAENSITKNRPFIIFESCMEDTEKIKSFFLSKKYTFYNLDFEKISKKQDEIFFKIIIEENNDLISTSKNMLACPNEKNIF